MGDEASLARRAAAGDTAAFTSLVRLHEAAVRRFLARLGRDCNADDLAQETFLDAWRSAGAWGGTGSYRSWLFGIAWRRFLAARRATGRQAARDHAAWEMEESGAASPAAAEGAIDLARALATLPERERAAALLCYGEGCTHIEAAEAMGVPLGTLKSLAARARTALAAALESDG